jgi:sigma-E factor negative regulatory protein RseA
MTKANESFSAFLDGEASEIDVQRMLKALDENPDLMNEWHDLSKVQAGLQNDVVVDVALDMAEVPATGNIVDAPKKGFRLLQGGIAAAVAVIAITTVNLTSTELETPEVAQTTVEVQEVTPALAQQQFEAQQRLDLFLKEHAEQASFTTGHVVVPSDLEWIESE